MGDEPIERVVLPPDVQEEDIARVKALFPDVREILSIATPPRVPQKLIQ